VCEGRGFEHGCLCSPFALIPACGLVVTILEGF